MDQFNTSDDDLYDKFDLIEIDFDQNTPNEDKILVSNALHNCYYSEMEEKDITEFYNKKFFILFLEEEEGNKSSRVPHGFLTATIRNFNYSYYVTIWDLCKTYIDEKKTSGGICSTILKKYFEYLSNIDYKYKLYTNQRNNEFNLYNIDEVHIYVNSNQSLNNQAETCFLNMNFRYIEPPQVEETIDADGVKTIYRKMRYVINSIDSSSLLRGLTNTSQQLPVQNQIDQIMEQSPVLPPINTPTLNDESILATPQYDNIESSNIENNQIQNSIGTKYDSTPNQPEDYNINSGIPSQNLGLDSQTNLMPEQQLNGMSEQQIDGMPEQQLDGMPEGMSEQQLDGMPEQSQSQVDPLAQSQVDPLAQSQVDPLAQSQVDPLAQGQVDPLAQQPVDPLAQQPQVDPLAQQPQVDPLAQGQVDPLAQQPQVDPLAQGQFDPLAQQQQQVDTLAQQQQVDPLAQQQQVDPLTQQQQVDPLAQQQVDPLAQQPQVDTLAQGQVDPLAQGQVDPLAQQQPQQFEQQAPQNTVFPEQDSDRALIDDGLPNDVMVEGELNTLPRNDGNVNYGGKTKKNKKAKSKSKSKRKTKKNKKQKKYKKKAKSTKRRVSFKKHRK
uniref:Uncharacterized protein n=1 Tax=viral metagenome TaxID=1070528 RepID=A0A6C0AXC2_9ZZZZ